jgi:hypothetical protein
MKLLPPMLMAAVLAAPAFRPLPSRVRSTAAAPQSGQADLVKGEASYRGVRGMPRRRWQFRHSRQSQARPAAPGIPGQAAAGVQVRQAQQRGHEGLCFNADRRGHEEHLVLGGLQARQARFRQGQRPGCAGRAHLPRRHADRQIAACAGCHSPNGAGIPVAISPPCRVSMPTTPCAAERLPRRLACQQPADDPGRRQAE